MNDHTLPRGRKHFCCYCLQGFSTKEILKCHVNDCFKVNGKQRIRMAKKSVRFKNYERKIKSPFMNYANLESVLVPEESGAKLCALSTVPYVLRALRTLVPHVPRALRALVPHVPRALRALLLTIMICTLY